ncbi:MAG: OmpA family protein [Ignavibacteriae bacterium]|nr:OmpA family protein [Ignavibacteriota bacterium]
MLNFIYGCLFICLFALSSGFAQITPNDGDWKSNSVTLKNTSEADVMIRIGDIDNLGFGFPSDFNPFTGIPTDIHPYPWLPQNGDLPGLDRIIVGSKFGKKQRPCSNDGYSGSNPERPIPIDIPLESVKGVKITSAMLTMFVDDFQAPYLCAKYLAYINGKRFGNLENILNTLNQGGPIGKFISVRIPPEMIDLLNSQKLSVMIDDTSGAADGFAIDFMKLLINPKPILYKNSITGYVQDKETGEKIINANVTVRGFGEATTDSEGKFTINNLPIGLIVAEANSAGYQSNSEVFDVIQDEPTNEQTINLTKAKDISFQNKKVEVGKAITLNNIQFKVSSAELNADAKTELNKVVILMTENPRIEIELSGHTSSEGTTDGNTQLSQSRVQSCKNYLTSKGIDEGRISAIGYGPSKPMADNTSEEGRVKNRRVEMKIVKI